METGAKLNIADADRVARWFLYRAGPDERGALMADMPLVYARMYPDVGPAVIVGNVIRTIEAARQN